ncbi:uncharacterized protein M6B38_151740 [Iris pallida]|uniref:Uncharacterized protein n=1 Tax=Iris pallida TaxID=29817 RepID=A0AAX6F6Q7_IRIPA|nr:uncharacterized protein M6B38_151740 [Iris pallida]
MASPAVPTPKFSLSPNVVTTSTTKLLFFPPKVLKSLKPLRSSSSSVAESPEEEDPEPADPVKLALAKAAAYRKSKKEKESTSGGDPAKEVPDSVKLAMEKAREYKKKNEVLDSSSSSDGKEKINLVNTREDLLNSKVRKKEGSTLTSIDFLGFGFSEKKSYRGMPPGLSPPVEPLLDGEIPEVELIVGDASKFEVPAPRRISADEDSINMDLYKPKVSTWGVFPRPNNISKTFGGGRVIRPGEVLETVEDKAAKEKHTRELIAAYRNKMGLNIDAKTKFECEKALKEGDNLMDLGKLREALPYYEKVMKAVVFQSELHGLAALQWSICQDSLTRSKDAKAMYEKLQSHSNAQVSKRARQFVFSFQAMDMMKVTTSSLSKKTGYENYFEAFVEKKAEYTPTEEQEESEGALKQAFPYIMFLLSPILVLVLIAVRKSL